MSHFQRHHENFAFDHEQYEVRNAALERASQLAMAMGSYKKSPSKSSLISWICVDFLASNDFGLPEEAHIRARYLKRFEMMSGKRLVMYDPVSHTIEYGYDAMLEMAGDD